jgi:hypothetical protein
MPKKRQSGRESQSQSASQEATTQQDAGIHNDAATHRDLPELLGPELRKLYRLPRDLPHKILTLLMKLNDPAKRHLHTRNKLSG